MRPHAQASCIVMQVRGCLQLDVKDARAVKDNGGRQAGNGLVVDGVDVGQDGVLARGDFLGQIDRLHNRDFALLNGALEIDVLDLLAQVGRGRNQTDQAVLDLKVDVGTLGDGGGDGANSLDYELSAAERLARLHILFEAEGDKIATYARGGLGESSTLLMVRTSLEWSAGQNWRGDLPGTLRSSREPTPLSLPKKFRLAAEAVERRPKRTVEARMIADVGRVLKDVRIRRHKPRVTSDERRERRNRKVSDDGRWRYGGCRGDGERSERCDWRFVVVYLAVRIAFLHDSFGREGANDAGHG